MIISKPSKLLSRSFKKNELAVDLGTGHDCTTIIQRHALDPPAERAIERAQVPLLSEVSIGQRAHD
jgi:hypothetical protein